MRGSFTRTTGAVAGFLACLAFPRSAAAQGPSVWHATVAPTHEIGLAGSGPWVMAWDFSGGGEWRQGPAGISLEVSSFYFPPITEPARFTPPLISVFSAYHFGQPGRPHTIEPFVEGGLGILIAGVGPIVDVGGGADWWLTSRLGIRTAVRDQMFGTIGFEVGLVFRRGDAW